LVDAAAQLCTTSGRTQVSLPVARAIRLVGLLSETLAVLEDMPPNAFAAIRPSLGNGSGAQSPGWRSLRLAARVCGRALRIAGAHRQDAELHVVANGLRTLDERVADWRRRHYAVAERLLGTDGVGTAGTPVPVLARTVDQHLLPMLWQQPAQAATGGAR
jgi:tryptophan 2,3-dioxygenase